MNQSNYLVGVRIDGDTRGLVKAAEKTQKVTAGMGADIKKVSADIAAAGVTSSNSSTKQNTTALNRMRTDFERAMQAREVLGVRSDRRIQQEILRTQAAYKRLATDGTLSWREQRMAAGAMHREVAKLNNEMGILTSRQRAAAGFRGAGMVGASVVGAVSVFSPKLQKAQDYETRLTHMTNTAFNDRSDAGRFAGRDDLDTMVKDAIRYGGGSRDEAASTLSTLLAAGAFKPKDASIIFREAVKAGTANDAEGALFANLAVKANKSMGIAPERMSAMFGIGTYAGQQGQFEIRDMAKHLPRQMGSATQIGLYGEKGFAKLAAVNQAAMNTAGSADEAGINVANLVAKIGSEDTRKQFQKQFGVDIKKELAQGRMKGLDGFDVVGGLLDKELSKNKNYRAIQKQLQMAPPGSEREAMLNSVGNIAEGTVVGRVFQDQQALMALVAYMQDRKRVNQIAGDSLNNTDAVERNMVQVRNTAGFSDQSKRNALDIANQDAMNKLTPAIKWLTDKTVSLSQEYPGYAAAISGATTTVTALGVAAGYAALAMTVLGLGGKAGRIPGLPPAGGPKGAPGTTGPWPASAGRGAGGAARALGGAFSTLLGPLMLLETLTQPSDEDIAKVREMDRAKSGYRGKGFTDPRLLSATAMPVQSLQQRLGNNENRGPMMMMPAPQGELLVRILSAPGVTYETQTRSTGMGLKVSSDSGRTNPEMGGMLGSGR